MQNRSSHYFSPNKSQFIQLLISQFVLLKVFLYLYIHTSEFVFICWVKENDTGPKKSIAKRGDYMPGRAEHSDPQVCFAIMSADRTHYLKRCLESLFEHIRLHEPGLRYKSVWIDRGTSYQNELAFELQAKHWFDTRLLHTYQSGNTYSEGIPVAYKQALTLCQGVKYTFFIEEDMILTTLAEDEFIKTAISFLDQSPNNFLGFSYRNDISAEGPIKHINFTHNGKNYHICGFLNREYQFTNGVGIYKTSLLGNMDKEINQAGLFELDMASAAKRLNYYYGIINANKSCNLECNQQCYACFNHTGMGPGASTQWRKKKY